MTGHRSGTSGHGDGSRSATVAVRVRAGAGRDQAVGYVDGVLRVKVAAPAVEGRANEALVEFLAELLGLRPRQVAIVKGPHSKSKVVRVDGLEQAELVARLEKIAGAGK